MCGFMRLRLRFLEEEGWEGRTGVGGEREREDWEEEGKGWKEDLGLGRLLFWSVMGRRRYVLSFSPPLVR